MLVARGCRDKLHLTSLSLTIPGGMSGGRLRSRSGRNTPQSVLPFWIAIACARGNHMRRGLTGFRRLISGPYFAAIRASLRPFAGTNEAANAQHHEGGSARCNPACPCRIVRFMFSLVRRSARKRRSSWGGYVDAVAGVRLHSIAASAMITMVTTNRPTTIILSTDPSC
jgi:hypothetical protein